MFSPDVPVIACDGASSGTHTDTTGPHSRSSPVTYCSHGQFDEHSTWVASRMMSAVDAPRTGTYREATAATQQSARMWPQDSVHTVCVDAPSLNKIT